MNPAGRRVEATQMIGIDHLRRMPAAARQWRCMIRALAGRPGAPDCFLLKALLA